MPFFRREKLFGEHLKEIGNIVDNSRKLAEKDPEFKRLFEAATGIPVAKAEVDSWGRIRVRTGDGEGETNAGSIEMQALYNYVGNGGWLNNINWIGIDDERLGGLLMRPPGFQGISKEEIHAKYEEIQFPEGFDSAGNYKGDY